VRILREGEEAFDRYLSQVEGRRGQEGLHHEGEVRSILRDVSQRGDEALIYYTWLLDGVRLSIGQLRVKREEVKLAYRKVPRDFLATLEKAASRIRRFHRLLSTKSTLVRVGSERGIWLGQMIRPLERVGIYVPGGKASYPSTVLMAAIPAKVAGVREIIMTTPPHEEGISPAVLVAADLAGVDQIFGIGGAQAIAALAYGTASIPKVDKIVGPGNRYVATAKQMVYGNVGIDMVAGPSEIVIISDGKTPPSFVAADLLSQAEHDEMALAILITTSVAFGKTVKEELGKQLSSLKRMKIARMSLHRRGAILIVKDLEQAARVANRIAPEHLELSLSKPLALAKSVRNAGAVFLGPYTPEAIGDYLAGPNHILPTSGTARFSSPLGVEDFIKRTNLMSFTPAALRRFEKDVKRFTEWEGLEGHYQAVQMRVKSDEKRSKGRGPA
jgi:histidinol dehydrogenase